MVNDTPISARRVVNCHDKWKSHTRTKKDCCLSSRSKTHSYSWINWDYSSYSFQSLPYYLDPSIYIVAAAAAKSRQSCSTVRPDRWQPTRLRHPWDSPGKNTGVGCHFLLQCGKVKNESEVAQSCPTLHDPMDCSLPGSSVHGILALLKLAWEFGLKTDFPFSLLWPLKSLWCSNLSFVFFIGYVNSIGKIISLPKTRGLSWTRTPAWIRRQVW